MVAEELLRAMLDSLKDPLVFVDTDHIIRYMNPAGAVNYKKWGGYDLVGKSVLDCHNERSVSIIKEILAEMHNGLEERLIAVRPGRRVYMRAVRDTEGNLLGYYERYEFPMSEDS